MDTSVIYENGALWLSDLGDFFVNHSEDHMRRALLSNNRVLGVGVGVFVLVLFLYGVISQSLE